VLTSWPSHIFVSTFITKVIKSGDNFFNDGGGEGCIQHFGWET
jgi:hypothetical protein